MRKGLLMGLIMLAAGAGLAAGAAERPDRVMPFLSRDAVVREAGPKMILLKMGSAPAAIVVGKAAPGPLQAYEDQQMRKAAEVLAAYLAKITGVACPVVETAPAGGRRIFVGADGDPSAAFPELKDADDHGFLIAARDDDLHIVGRSGDGDVYGAWFFLYNYAGLRIVMTGEIGEVYQKRDVLSIPEELYVLNPRPDFLLRIWSQPGFDQSTWLQDTSASSRFEYHHNMWRMFPPTEYGDSHPEYYPVILGKRHIPPAGARSKWQPTFSEPAVAERVVEYADDLFAQHPQMKSVSVTVNDGGGHSELDGNTPAEVRDTYYRFVNAVARDLGERWPDKYVAFLPYAAVQEPPDFKLEDNVIMFIFSYAGNPKQIYDKWSGKVSHVGVYQWLYGSCHVIPNHWPHAIQDYLQWLRERGGNAFKGEAYVPWAQGGLKMWVLSNLLWDADADVDALIQDYLVHCYGQEAAPAMGDYFAQAEKIYARRRTPDEFHISQGYKGLFQFDHATDEDFRIMAAAIDEANRVVRGDDNKKRVDMTSRCFRFGDHYWKSYQAYRRLDERLQSETATSGDPDAIVAAAARFLDAKEQRDAYRDEYLVPLPDYCLTAKKPRSVEEFGEDYNWLWRYLPRFEWDWLYADVMDQIGEAFDEVTRQKRADSTAEEVAEYWRGLAEEQPALKPFADQQRLNLLHADKPLRNLLANGSFETAAAPDDPTQRETLQALQDRTIRFGSFDSYEIPGVLCRDWFLYELSNAGATTSLDPEVKREGKVSMTARGRGRHCGAITHVQPPSNRARYRISFWYRTSANLDRGLFGVFFYDVPRVELCNTVLPRATEWTRFERVFTVDYPDRVKTDFTVVLSLDRSRADDAQIWFDDVRVEMLSPEGVAGR